MILRKLEEADGKLFLDLLLELDHETTFMLYEEGERQTTSSEMQGKINGINNFNLAKNANRKVPFNPLAIPLPEEEVVFIALNVKIQAFKAKTKSHFP